MNLALELPSGPTGLLRDDAPTPCGETTVLGLLQQAFLGLHARPVFRPLVLRLACGAAVMHEGAHADSLYVVRSGSFKSARVLEDGYEQVLGFAARGDVLGFEGRYGGFHRASAIAMEDSTVYAMTLPEFDQLRRDWPEFDRSAQCALGRLLAQSNATNEMMAAVASDTRLARFLVWLSKAMAEQGESPRRFRLRMSRREIASLLGVAHETVSRSFSIMAKAGVLRVANREVEILDPGLLLASTRQTRGMVDEATGR